MAEQPPMIAPIAAPIFGSNGKPKLHFGSSITPSRVMNSCTRIVPMTSPSSGNPAAAPTLRAAEDKSQGQLRRNMTGPMRASTVAPVEVHVSLLGRTDLAGEIYRQLRAAIIAGRLRAGEPLPPTRELARRLSVSRGTVAVAYDRLSGEGFVTSRVGAGTFVTASAARGEPPAGATDGRLRPRPVWDGIPVATAFAAPARYEFRTGLPDASRFPFQT